MADSGSRATRRVAARARPRRAGRRDCGRAAGAPPTSPTAALRTHRRARRRRCMPSARSTPTPRRAQAEAHRRALGRAARPVGPLAGVPVAVKDLICTRGLRTTFGSRLYADHVPEEDDVVVERLRAAGAVIIGKTNTSEFGYGAVGHNPLFATTRNPWNPTLTPGGSSAGSAAAVAARMVPLALGSDGGGSVRIPAALRGVFGIKPSWGRVPVYPGCRDERYPGISSWESLEHIGPITRTCGRRRAGAVGAGRADAARPPFAAGGVGRLARAAGRRRCADAASPSASTWAMPWSTPRWRRPSRQRRCACGTALGADARREPARRSATRRRCSRRWSRSTPTAPG